MLLQGDMLLHLMDAAEPEFGLYVGSVPLLQLQSLLESAVRGSSAAGDPAAAKLAAAFDHRSILNMLIANQQALTAVPGAENKTPMAKVGGWLAGRVAGRGVQRALSTHAGGEPPHNCCRSPPALLQLKPTTPAPMTASERNSFGKKRVARESFMLSYEVGRVGWWLTLLDYRCCCSAYVAAPRGEAACASVPPAVSKCECESVSTLCAAGALAAEHRGARGGAGAVPNGVPPHL
jgi:hypothetical protein